jgi:hypothetical protein
MAISLDQINSEVENRYAPFVIEDVPGGDVQLRNAIRLAKSERAQLTELHGELAKVQDSGDAEAALDLTRRVVRLLSVGDGGERLLDAIGEDAAKLTYILQMYAEDTQMGEALRSGS